MSANDAQWDDSTVDEEVAASEGFKSLRTAYDKSQKELRQANEALAKSAAERRSETLVAELRSAGVSEKAARYFPADQEASAEAVQRWLAEEGELFRPAQAAEATPPAGLSPEADQARKVAAASNAAPVEGSSGGFEDSVSKLSGLNVGDSNFLGNLREIVAAART